MDHLSFFLDPWPAEVAVDRLARLLDLSAPADAAWTLHLLGGGRALRPGLAPALLNAAARRACGLPDWLFEASHKAVGDLAETVALGMADSQTQTQPGPAPSPSLSAWITQVLTPLKTHPCAEEALVQAWRALHGPAREVAIRVSFGRWPAVLSPQTLQAAVARHAGLPPTIVAQRWADWTTHAAGAAGPTAAGWSALVAPARADESGLPVAARVWPVFDGDVSSRQDRLGPVDDWIALPDLGGLPVRLVREPGPGGVQTRLWTTGPRLLDAAFPDLIEATAHLPAPLVLDGELLPREPGGTLQARLGKTPPGAGVCRRTPVWLRVFEGDGIDGHDSPFWRRAEPVVLTDWRGAEGLLLMRREPASSSRAAPGEIERERWRLAVTPMTARVLLLHAQPGTGGDAGLHVDCTLAVWNRPPRDVAEVEAVIEAIALQRAPDPSPDGLLLLPLARCAQGLSADERTRIDRLVRGSTVARHGPVRSVRPGLVMSLAFDAIEANTRRRSGVMVREPRLQGLRDDLSPLQASSLVELLAQADQRRTRFGCQ